MADEGKSEAWKMVDEATTQEDIHWGLNLTIFWKIQRNELNASEVVKAIKKKIDDKSCDVQRHTLNLLQAFGHKCDAFYYEVAYQNLHEDMVRLVDNPQNDYTNRRMAFKLIRAWSESRDVSCAAFFHRVYWSLKDRVPHDMAERKSVPVRRTLGCRPRTPKEDPFDLLERYQPISDQERIDLLEGRREPKFVEERNKYLVLARKSLESLFSILHSEGESKPLKEHSTLRWLDRCKKSLHVMKKIWETCTNHEIEVWLEAIRLNDQLELVIGKYWELEAAEMNAAQQPQKAEPAKHDA